MIGISQNPLIWLIRSHEIELVIFVCWVMNKTHGNLSQGSVWVCLSRLLPDKRQTPSPRSRSPAGLGPKWVTTSHWTLLKTRARDGLNNSGWHPVLIQTIDGNIAIYWGWFTISFFFFCVFHIIYATYLFVHKHKFPNIR